MPYPSRFSSLRTATALLAGASLLFACVAQQASTKKKKPVDPGDDWFDEDPPQQEQPIQPSYVNGDSGAFGASSRPAHADGGGAHPDAGMPDADAGPKVACTGPLAAGDLAIVEVLIASRTGSGDLGEWVEVQNTRDCWLNVKDVTIESPRGTSDPNVATVTSDLELAPKGTFVVAGSADPTQNNGLPGTIVTWNATDVLKNDGDTVTVKSGTTTIDTVTYPSLSNLEAGRSFAFPADCPANDRSDWTRWSLTFTEHAPGQKGTPNAPNDDVACF